MSPNGMDQNTKQNERKSHPFLRALKWISSAHFLKEHKELQSLQKKTIKLLKIGHPHFVDLKGWKRLRGKKRV